MSRFDLNLIGSLDALLLERNVTSAAARMGVTQPTMSGMLNRLREQLNDPLLVRVGNAYELTARALAIQERVRQLLLEAENLTRPSADLETGTVKRHLRMMASEYGMLLILPSFLRKVAKEAPGLSFEIVPIFDPLPRVYHGDVDLCISGAMISDVMEPIASAVRAQTILTDQWVGLVDQAHPIGDHPSAAQILAYPRVATLFPGSARTAEDEVMPKLTAERGPILHVPSFISIAPLVIGTDRIGIMQTRLARILDPIWKLRRITLPDAIEETPVRILWHLRYDEDALHRWVREQIAHAAGELMPAGID